MTAPSPRLATRNAADPTLRACAYSNPKLREAAMPRASPIGTSPENTAADAMVAKNSTPASSMLRWARKASAPKPAVTASVARRASSRSASTGRTSPATTRTAMAAAV